MNRTKYLFSIGTAIVLAAALYWWNRKPNLVPAETVTDEKRMAYYYAVMTSHLFNIQLTGTLRLIYPLNNDPELSAAGFPCILLHVTETTPEGTARSQWKLPFTESYLVPHGHNDLQWCQPSGRIVLFKNGRTTRDSVVKSGEGWELRKLGPLAYDVSNSLGDSYFYDDGSLSEVTTRSSRHYRVMTRGGLITRVTEIGRRGPQQILFSAQFDDFGHCIRLQFSRHPAEEFDWDAEGSLQEWKDGFGHQLGFQYNEGLLERVTAPGKVDFPITWSENKEFVRHHVFFGAPVYVKSAGPRNYILSYSSHGILIATKCPDEKQNSTTLYNPLAHTVVQKSDRETLHFDFESVEGETILRTQKVEITDSKK